MNSSNVDWNELRSEHAAYLKQATGYGNWTDLVLACAYKLTGNARFTADNAKSKHAETYNLALTVLDHYKPDWRSNGYVATLDDRDKRSIEALSVFNAV